MKLFLLKILVKGRSLKSRDWKRCKLTRRGMARAIAEIEFRALYIVKTGALEQLEQLCNLKSDLWCQQV